MEDKWVINVHGVVNSIPADMELPPGVRLATTTEIAAFQAADAEVAAIRRVEVTLGASSWEQAKRKRRGWR